MIGTAAHIRRTLGCIAGATIAGIPVEMLFLQVWRMNSDVFQHELPVLIALPLAVGLGAAIGLEIAAQPLQTIERISAWNRTIDVASLILLGILCGGLVAALIYEQAAEDTTADAIALAFLSFSIAAARMLARWHIHDANAVRLASFCVIFGLLYGLSMVTGATLAREITYQPPTFHSWGLDLPSWPILLLMTSFFLGLPVGLWLAITLWLALLLSRRATSHHPTTVAL